MPLPDNYQLPKRQTQEFELFDEGTYNVKIDRVVLKKDQPVWNNPDEKEDKLTFHLKVLDDGAFKGHIMFLAGVRLGINPAFSGGSASWLYKILCAANKTILTEEQCELITGKDINALEGRVISVLVKQKPNSKGVIGSKITDCFKSNIGEAKIAANPSVMERVEQTNNNFAADLEAEAKRNETAVKDVSQDEGEINVDDIPF